MCASYFIKLLSEDDVKGQLVINGTGLEVLVDRVTEKLNQFSRNILVPKRTILPITKFCLKGILCSLVPTLILTAVSLLHSHQLNSLTFLSRTLNVKPLCICQTV